jgi:hypothetical protein
MGGMESENVDRRLSLTCRLPISGNSGMEEIAYAGARSICLIIIGEKWRSCPLAH